MNVNYLIKTTESHTVELWSVKRLSFEPKGWDKEMRNVLKSKISELVPYDNSIFHATYISKKDIYSNFDVENILFYNVGESCFKNICRKEIIFERKIQEPPKHNDKNIEIDLPFYSSYKIEGYSSHYSTASNLAKWNAVRLPNMLHKINPYEVWYLMKKGDIETLKSNKDKGFVGLKIKIDGPRNFYNCGLNIAKILKPLIDGVVSVFNYYSGFNYKEIASLISNKLFEDSTILEEMILEKTNAVLGGKEYINKRANWLQWNPSDDLISYAEIIVSYENNANTWNHSGEIFEL